MAKGLQGLCAGAWCIVGDFNNILGIDDRTGGIPLHPLEYQGLKKMMGRVRLFKCQIAGEPCMWTNIYQQDIVYSKIGRVLGNVPWLLQFSQCLVEVLLPNISDHSPLRVGLQIPKQMRVSQFKFVNWQAEEKDFKKTVAEKWHSFRVEGDLKFKLWKKLQLLKPVLREMTKKIFSIKRKIG